MIKRFLSVLGHVLVLLGCTGVFVALFDWLWQRCGVSLPPLGVLLLWIVLVGVSLCPGHLMYALVIRGWDLAKQDRRSLAEYLQGEQPNEYIG